MFGLVSMSTVALVVLYGLGAVQMFKGAMDAGKGIGWALYYAASWPLSMWKLMKDLWSAPPPPTY